MRLSRRSCPEQRYDDGASGRLLGILYVLSGAVTLASPLLPTPPGFDHVGVVWVGIVAVAAGLLMLVLPWRRWPRWVSVLGTPPALALIAVHNIAGGADPYRYSIFLLVVFVFIGVTQDRGTGLLLSPLALLSYLVPLLVTDAPASAIASVAYALPIFIGVSETLSWRSQSLRDAEVRLQRLAYADPLTGLCNRARFVTELERVVAGPPSERARAWVLFCDLDGFKAVNDTWGHAAGHVLLRDVAASLRQAAGDRDVACRWAGDEFALLLRDLDRREAEHAADLVRFLVAAVPTAAGHGVSVIVGLATTAGAATPDEIMANADAAMYTAKSQRVSPKQATGQRLVPQQRSGHVRAQAR